MHRRRTDILSSARAIDHQRDRARRGLTITGGTPAAPMIIVQHPNGTNFFIIDDAAGGTAPTVPTWRPT